MRWAAVATLLLLAPFPAPGSNARSEPRLLALSSRSITVEVPGLDHARCCERYRDARLQDSDGLSIEIRAFGSDRQAVALKDRRTAITQDRLHLQLEGRLQPGRRYRLSLPGLATLAVELDEGAQTDFIQVNQLGYAPAAPKFAFAGGWLGTAGPLPVPARDFQVLDESGVTVFRGPLEPVAMDDPWSGNDVYRMDFSPLERPGTYRIRVPGLGLSHPFPLDRKAYTPVARSVLRVFYHSRNDTAISAPWSDPGMERPGGVPSRLNGVFHPAVGGAPLGREEQAGAFHPVRRGWFDAGDYGQYVTNAAPVWYAVGVGMDLAAGSFVDGSLGIPESGNGIPDILDELEWGMDWALSMQDSDGGIYWRIASRRWDEELPHRIEKPRFVFEKTTHATAAFAAMAALHARLIAPYRPRRAAQVLQASRKAWEFVQDHPRWPAEGERYRNPQDISAGEYPDLSAEDALAWAAAELYRTTGDGRYATAYEEHLARTKLDPTGMVSFKDQGMAALWAYLRASGAEQKPMLLAQARLAIVSGADWRIARMEQNPFRASAHPAISLTGWGNFAHSTRATLPLLQAYHLTGESRYRDRAWESPAVQMGTNPQGLCYITGWGARSPRHPLSQLSILLPGEAPLSGLPVNGPHYQLPNSWDSTRAVNRAYWPGGTDQGPVTDYPALRRYTDNEWLPPMSEPTIAEVALTGVALTLLSDQDGPMGWPAQAQE